MEEEKNQLVKYRVKFVNITNEFWIRSKENQVYTFLL